MSNVILSLFLSMRMAINNNVSLIAKERDMPSAK